VFVRLACHYKFVRIRQMPDQNPPASELEQRSPGRWQGPSRACRDPRHGSPSVAGRFAFWQSLHERMSGLGNRLDPRHKRSCLATSMPASQWPRATNCGRCNWPTPKPTQRFGMLANVHARTVEGHKDLIANAERTKAAHAAELANAVVQPPTSRNGGSCRGQLSRSAIR
jgi:hypothetical protein